MIGKYCLILAFMFYSLVLSQFAQGKTYYGDHLCAYPAFKCVKVKRGDTWAKLFPNRRNREIVKRLNRTNMALRHRKWIIIPENINQIGHMDMSPFPDQIQATGNKLLYIDLKLQAFGAYDANGILIHWGPVSGGRGWCDDVGRACKTATGKYRIIRKQGSLCESSKFPIETDGGAPMPYCMHYYRGYALHGSTLPGYHDSHGCIRLFFDDAKWLNEKFTQIGTRVIVVE